MKQFIEMKEASMEENENLITKFGLLELKESNNRVKLSFVGILQGFFLLV
jgi:hypothetical protein